MRLAYIGMQDSSTIAVDGFLHYSVASRIRPIIRDMGTQTTSEDTPASSGSQPSPGLIRGLSFTDAVLLIIGGVVASAIFLTPTDVASALPSPIWFFFAWIAGGIVSLMAGFAFGELGAMFPEAGGQYVYLREAFGDFFAFQYGWLMFVAGSSGGIASIAVGFARYLGKAVPVLASEHVLFTITGLAWNGGHVGARSWNFTTGDLLATTSILLLTFINVRGLRPAVIFQNVSTWLKYAAFAAFLIFGFAIGKGSWSHFTLAGIGTPFHAGNFYPFMSALGIAFIAVFWTYDGWVYVSWTAGEVRDPERTIPRSLVLGIAHRDGALYRDERRLRLRDAGFADRAGRHAGTSRSDDTVFAGDRSVALDGDCHLRVRRMFQLRASRSAHQLRDGSRFTLF